MKRGGDKKLHISGFHKNPRQRHWICRRGAKLSLLIAQQVVTESKGGYGSQCATTCSLRAVPRRRGNLSLLAQITTPRGTSVAIHLRTTNPTC